MTHKGPGGHSTRGSHRLSQVATCDRKWWLRWGRGIVENNPPIYFLEGTLIHIALAYYRANWLHQRGGLPVPQWFYDESMMDCLHRTGAGFPDAIQLALNTFNAYHARYSQNDSWEPVSIEEEYQATLGQIRKLIEPNAAPRSDDDEIVTSRIDFLLRNNGYLWACDYKSTKDGASRGKLFAFNVDGDYAVNFQFLLQTAILRVNFGSEFRGVVVERVLKCETPDFDRTPAPIHNSMLRALPDTLSRLALLEKYVQREATEAREGGADMKTWLPTASPFNCFSYGRPCEYRPICLADGARQQEDIMVREYHVV